jgi:hypothetical protein
MRRVTYGCRVDVEDAADHDAVHRYVEIVVTPFARRSVCCGVLSDQLGHV